MDAVRVAAPLARLLLVAGEARRDGALWLEQGGRTVRLTLCGGQLVALKGVPLEPLGDLLRELDAVDGTLAHGEYERTRDVAHVPPVPIGVRLIAAGATSWSAVQRALYLQRMRALARLLQLPVTRTWRSHGPLEPQRGGVVSVNVVAAVWSTMLALVERLPARQCAQLAQTGQALVLNAAGRRRVRALDAELAPAVDAQAIERALSQDAGASPLRVVLVALGLAQPHSVREEAYTLLLRKRRELARNASPQALLDLPYGSDAAGVQRALRRLAIKLHPDRFHRDDERLSRLSHEVMGALTRAASHLQP